MYVCGPTVYDDPHVGNARPLIVIFDLFFRRLLKIIHNQAMLLTLETLQILMIKSLSHLMKKKYLLTT